MEEDPFFHEDKKVEETPPVEEKKEEPPKKPEPPKKLPEVKVEVPEEKKVKEKVKKEKPKKEKTKREKIYITDGKVQYTKRQKTVAKIIYISIVISCLITIFGVIVTVANYIVPSGKFSAFLEASLGTKIAIIGGALAGTFFLIFFFYGLAKKGISVITKIVFKTRELDSKYKNKGSVKLFAGAIMLSIFAIIIGIIWGLIEEALSGGTGTLSAFLTTLGNENMGLIIILVGAALLTLNGLVFALNFLWYNGYYVIIKMIGGLDSED
jgi:hypothetical protein